MNQKSLNVSNPYGSFEQFNRPNTTLALVPNAPTSAELIQLMSSILNSQTIESVWDEFMPILQKIGFDRLLYVSTHFRIFGEFGDLADALILSNYPDGYAREFLSEEMYKYDPLLSADKDEGVESWISSKKQYKCNTNCHGKRRFFELNRKWGFDAGLSVSLGGLGERNRVYLGLAARQGLSQNQVNMIWSIHGKDILTLLNLVRLRISNLPSTGKIRPLTGRQVEVLEWVANGKTTAEIASILYLSAATIEKHLRSAREALGAETTAQAVHKATKLNLLYV